MRTKNIQRAARAGRAIDTYRRLTGTDHESALRDLLCDLMHWADCHDDIEFDTELAAGEGHYAAEQTEEGEL